MSWVKYFVLFGVFLMNVPNGVTWYFGNLSSYTACVFRKQQGVNIESPWLMSVEVACWTLGIILGGLLDAKIGPRCTMLLGSVLFNLSMFLTYLTFDLSFVAFILSLGVLTGIADGILHSASLYFIVMWVDSYVGLATGLTTSSLGLGAVLINLIITRYINPLNLSPDAMDGSLRVFTQDDILKRVPRVFLVLGTFSTLFHFLGFVFLQSRQPRKNGCLRQYFTSTQPITLAKQSGPEMTTVTGGEIKSGESTGTSGKDSFFVDSDCHETKTESSSSSSEFYVTLQETSSHKDTDRLIPDSSDVAEPRHKAPKTQESRPRECTHRGLCSINAAGEPLGVREVLRIMLKTKELYILVLLQFSMDYSLIIVSHFYKLFGQTWFIDDRGLALLGTVMTVSTILPKLALGALQDRIGLKETWIIITAGTSITSAFWYFTPKVSKWMYFVWTVGITWFACAFDSLVVAGVVEIYGTYRCNLKYGVVAAFSTALQLSAPPLISGILDSFHWLGLFLSVSCLHCLCLMVSVWGLPGSDSTRTSEDPSTSARSGDSLGRRTPIYDSTLALYHSSLELSR